MAQVVPYDEPCERMVLGDMLADRREVTTYVARSLEPTDFYVPAHVTVFLAACALERAGEPVNAGSVWQEIRQSVGERGMEWSWLFDLSKSGSMAYHRGCDRLVELGDQRHTIRTIEEAQNRARAGDDPLELFGWLQGQRPARNRGPLEGWGTWDELLNERRPSEEAWAVPGLLRRNWRLLLVGPEGRGKSTLLRQVAICASLGVHPFTFSKVQAVRTLVCDYENPRDALLPTARTLVDLACKANPEADLDMGRLLRRPGGADLRNSADRRELEQALAEHQPELVVIGPVYKAFRSSQRESEDEAAKPIQDVLEDLRTRYNFALVVEHHAPLAPVGGRREWRPRGSGQWLYWPDMGFGMAPDEKFPETKFHLTDFRGSRVKSGWPKTVERGGAATMGAAWPWIGAWGDEGMPRMDALD